MNSPLHPLAPILLVDDEEQALRSYDLNLRFSGLTNTMRCSDSRQVKELLRKHEFSLIMLDLSMPHVGGEELLEYVRQERPHTPTIVVTGHNEVETAVRCMRTGSLDYLVKPVDRSRLLSAVRQALELNGPTVVAEPGEDGSDAFAAIVTGNERMRAIRDYVKAVAGSMEAVLIVGETGVGKELLARAIHRASGRTGRFVGVNVAGLDDVMFSDTLFGHRKGAFTGAGGIRSGLIEEAAGGSLFLDEIGDLGLNSQLKLLRLIQEREYYPLGSDAPRAMETRLIVATNQPMAALMDAEKFRRDLFFRLRTHYIQAPPLRERLDDLPLLVDRFLDKAAGRLGKKKPAASSELLALLSAYHFPGNVRELESMILNALALHDSGKLSLAPFKAWISSVRSAAGFEAGIPSPGEPGENDAPSALPTLREAEESVIQEALRRAGGNQSTAASMLGISRQALNRRLLSKKR